MITILASVGWALFFIVLAGCYELAHLFNRLSHEYDRARKIDDKRRELDREYRHVVSYTRSHN